MFPAILRNFRTESLIHEMKWSIGTMHVNLLSAKQISTVPNLQRHDVDVQTTLQRCVMALNAPMKLAHLMF